MMPTIFVDVQSWMTIAQEEIFGPVLSVIKFHSEEEAIQLANDVAYGLAASVWTRDTARLFRVTNLVKSGIVWANCVFVGNPAVPFGGFKASGFGNESGLEAGLEYTRLKTVWINTSNSVMKWPN
jgi:aldehyde dehydrogenase (NAD+)